MSHRRRLARTLLLAQERVNRRLRASRGEGLLYRPLDLLLDELIKKVWDKLVLTMGTEDATRRFPANALEVYKLGDYPAPFWEYKVGWPDGIIRVQEFILSPRD